MDPDLWRRIEVIYHEVLTLPIPARQAYLDRACAGDAVLRQEVESLLRHAGESESLLRTTPSEPLARTDEPADRDTWGEFRLSKLIGRGGFGRVYLAWDEALAREIALKVVRPRDAADLDMALREGQMLARVRHRNVVTVFSAKRIDDEVGIAMELIKGRHLAEIVRQHGPMGAEEAVPIGIHLGQALSAVHGASLLHRDIKAHNVMRESGGRLVLMDFGASRDAGPAAHARADLTGTLLYLAPEVLAGAPASRASDIYSLGVLLFFLVTGTYPVEGATVDDVVEAHRAGVRKRLADCRPDLETEFVRLVERATAPRPEDRYQSAGELLADLSDVAVASSGRLRDASLSAPAVTVPARSPVEVWGMRAASAAATVAVLPTTVGFLTTVAFDASLSRQGFSDHSVWTWWSMGLQAIVPVAALALAFLAVIWLIVTSGRLVYRAVRPGAPAGWVGRLRQRLTVNGDLTPAAQAVAMGQFVAIAVVAWFFRDFLLALIYQVNTADRRLWAVLDYDNPKIFVYLPTVSFLLATAGYLWARLIRARRAGGRLEAGAAVVGVLLSMLLLLMGTVPWRLVYGSTPRVDIGAERCYEIGRRADTLLLFCPDSDRPRNRTRAVTDPALVMVGAGHMFATPAAAAIEKGALEKEKHTP